MVRDCSNSDLTAISEGELAAWRRAQGAQVVCHRGRYWEASPRGIFHGLHLMARMSAAEATGPTRLCWGYRTTLRQEIILGALIFEFVQACRRSNSIAEVVYGLRSREDEPHCHYKERMGFPLVHIPAWHHFLPGAGRVLQCPRPHAYYRLVGRDGGQGRVKNDNDSGTGEGAPGSMKN